MKYKTLITASLLITTGFTLANAAEQVNIFDGQKGAYQPDPDGGRWYWRSIDAANLVLVVSNGPSGKNFRDGMMWKTGQKFCEQGFNGKLGWKLPTISQIQELQSLSKDEIEEKLSYNTSTWVDAPYTLANIQYPNVQPTTDSTAKLNTICVLDKELSAKLMKNNSNPTTKNSKKLPNGDTSLSESKPAESKTPTTNHGLILHSTSTDAKEQLPSSPPSTDPTTTQQLQKQERKTYPFTKSTTYSSTYRNTDQERAMTTMNEERIKGEKSFGFAASWTTVSETAPQCATTKPKNLYWICKTTVTYSGQSYFSQGEKNGPSKVIGK